MILLIGFSSTRLMGQDFLITTRQDTVRGKITIEPSGKVDKLLVNVNGRKAEYAAYSVVSFSVGGNRYQPVRIPEEIRFMLVGKAGSVSLCYARQVPGAPFDIPYLVKVSGESMEVNNLRFKRSVTKFLSDCATIQHKIESDSLGRDDLEEIVDRYNKCIEMQTTTAFAVTEDPKLAALNAFNKKLEKESGIPADAREILKDLYLKVKEGKPVPNYMADGLRETLKDFPSYREDLESLLVVLKK